MTKSQMVQLQAGFTRLSREHRKVILGAAEALVFAESSMKGDRHPVQSEQVLAGELSACREKSGAGLYH